MRGEERGMEKGREEGMEKGKCLKSIDDILKMDKLKMTMELMKDFSGFSEIQINEILSLKKNKPNIQIEDIYNQLFDGNI